MPADILLVSIVRALVEVAGALLVGQGALWIFGPKARDGNFVYDLFKKGTRPLIILTRTVTPRVIHDAHIGFVTFFFLVCLWLVLGFAKHSMCTARGLVCA